MGGIYGGITTDNYLQSYSLGNQPVEDFVENILSQTVTEVSKGAIGGGLEEVEAAEETEPAIIA